MKTLIHNLRSWQRHEWLYRVMWGSARLALLVVIGLTLACFTDWLVDRSRDTPMWLRVLLSFTQVVGYSLAAYFFLFRLGVPSIDSLAFRAEKAIPEFDHRLVTALQLNRPEAQTSGMSPELIQAVTREAERLSTKHSFKALIDRSRLEWAVALLIPVLLFTAGFVALRPTLTMVLLSRQLLLPVSIPRSFAVTNVTPELWPSGDEVVLRFEVTGPIQDDTTGQVRVMPEDQPAETFPLTLTERISDEKAIFTAKLPPSSAPFAFRAHIVDGRMREPGKVRFEARPVVQEIEAWVLMPTYVDPEGKKRYETLQPQGEVIAYADSAIRVELGASKPVRAATVVLYSRDQKSGTEVASGRLPMVLSADRIHAEVQFDLPARPSSYRLELVDDNGFTNLTPPRRGISVAADRPPTVRLLREIMKDPLEKGPDDDFDVTGMPMTPFGRVQIGFKAHSPLGIAKVYIVYRVGRPAADGGLNFGPWLFLPLAKTEADTAKVGPFLPDLGVFQKSGRNGSVEFYPIPSPDPDSEPDGLQAGGRYNFQAAALKRIESDGTESKLSPGDVVQFYVAAMDRNPARTRPLTDPDPDRDLETPVPPGRAIGWSEKRETAVVSLDRLQEWTQARDESKRRLAELETKQRDVFNPRKTSP